MDKGLSERESERRAEQRRASQRINEFCEDHGISRAKAYQEIAAGRLRAVKVGSATLILAEDAGAWRASLPAMAPRGAGKAA
jgi:hypothetical protein